MEVKRCAKCRDVKPIDEFHKNASNSDGLNIHCKVCFRIFRRASEKKRRAERKKYVTPEEVPYNVAEESRKHGNAKEFIKFKRDKLERQSLK